MNSNARKGSICSPEIFNMMILEIKSSVVEYKTLGLKYNFMAAHMVTDKNW
jgi:hypothetical protein